MMKAPQTKTWTATLGGLLTIVLFLGFTPRCLAQQIELQGNDTNWKRVGNIRANTPFMIEADGMVDFGGILHNNNDGVTAGVTGNAFWGAVISLWKDAGSAIQILSEVAPIVADIAADSTAPSPQQAWQTLIQTKAAVNYDEGGFWVAIMTADRAPNNASDTSLVVKPALYYWYNQLYDQKLNIIYGKDVYVWVRSHDGGGNPFKQGDDWSDNSGSYSIWLNAIDTPMPELITLGKADSAGAHGPLLMSREWTHPVPLESGRAYRLQSVQTSKLIHSDAVMDSGGANVSQYGDAASAEQMWRPSRQNDGSYTLQNVQSKGFLQEVNGAVRSFTRNQSEGWKAIANLDGTYCFMNTQSGNYLTASTNDNVFVQTADGSPSQKWKLSVGE